MELQAAMKFNLEERCQDTMGGMVRPSPDSPISSSCCDSEECGEIPHNFAVAMNLNLDEVCQHSMSGQMKAWPHTPISVSRCSSEQYGEPPQLFCSDDEKDPGHTEVWNTLKLKAAMKLNLDGVSRDSMSGRVTLSPGSRISSSRSSSMQYGETPRLFCIDDEIHGGNTEGAPSPSCVPGLLFNGLDEEEILPCLSFNDCEDLDGLVAKHQQRQVAAGVKVLQAGKPSLSTQLLAAAEEARRWLASFQSLVEATEAATGVAAQRVPQAASDVAKAASQRILCELRESRVAVKAFSRPEVFLLEAPASHCPETPREALECLMTALQRGRPSLTVRAVARAEYVRQSVLCVWKVSEQVCRDLFTSRVACTLAQKMEDCAAIADVYEHRNPRILSDEHLEQSQ